MSVMNTGFGTAVRLAAVGSVMLATPALAAEGGIGFYILGSKTTMGGYLPPPGAYGAVLNYFYTGDAGINFQTAGVTLSGGVEADAYVALPTALWVADTDILGGDLAFTLTTPVGGKRLEVGALSSPGRISFNVERDNFAFGDPVLGTSLGWHDGNMHYTLGSLISVPIGQWERGNPVNMGFNRWAIDTTAAATYLNPQTGVELSGAMGITYNFENPDTNYKTGTEFHAEAAAMMHTSQTFSIGLNGYAYKQISGDSGSGAVLGDFKGQVFAIGPALDYTFMVGHTPVVTNLRYFYEFGVENRLEGHAGFVNVLIPLGGQAPAGQH
jgi:hypothetical protein